MKLYKLSAAAKILDVTVPTLYNWRLSRKIEFIQSPTGYNYLSEKQIRELSGQQIEPKNEKVVIYCRVSSTINKKNLETQKQRLISYCNAKGYQVSQIVEEFGSGINDRRPKLEKLLKDQDFTKLVVEHKDRLTRLGFNYIQTLLKKNDIEIEVVTNVDTDQEDIIQDFVSIITSYCARIYGKRRSRRNTERLIAELKNDTNK